MTKSKIRVGVMSAAAVALASVLANACADPVAPVAALEGPAAATRAPGASAVAPVTFEDLFERASLQARAGDRRGARVWATPDAVNVPVGRIVIPAIGLDTSFRLGVHDAIVQLGPGLWPGTPLPGAPGNAVFAGHRTTFTHPFGDLDLLEEGDAIVTRVPGLGRTSFRVFRIAIVPEAGYADFVLRQPAGARARVITLFACTPKGQRTHRIVVQGRARPTDEKRGGRAPDRGEREDGR
jgi:LPXTG-site transpeptidase (sortase) family protein